METTREELLEHSRCEVDTTTPTASPEKPKKVTKKRVTTKGSKTASKTARIAAAKERAKHLFKKYHSPEESTSVVKLQEELKTLQKELKKTRAGNVLLLHDRCVSYSSSWL